MLVLAIRPGEKLVMVLPDGEECVLHVMQASRSGRIRLGLEFPDDIQILRDTVLDRIRAMEARAEAAAVPAVS